MEKNIKKIKGIIMVANYILIKTSPGQEGKVYKELKKTPEIVESYQLVGGYDIILQVKTKNYIKLRKIIMKKIRQINGVIDTKTLPGIKF